MRYIIVNTVRKFDKDDDDDNNTKVIPVMKGANGTISKSLRQYLSSKPGKREIKELQTTAILGTAQILQEVLM